MPIEELTESLSPEQRAVLKRAVESIPADFGGGSTIVKALATGNLVVANHYDVIVEIGVYRGRFLLPQAALLEHLGRGMAYGVDPYRARSAIQRDARRFPEGARHVNRWVRQQDWAELYRQVLDRIASLDVSARCQILRVPSRRAARLFPRQSIDVLHIDGNHDRRSVAGDARRWLPKVRPGGIVVFDDTTWATVSPVVEEVSRRGQVLVDASHGLPEDFAIVQLGEK